MSKLSIKNRESVDLSRSRLQLSNPVKTSMISVVVPESLFTKVKSKAALNGVTLRSLFTELMEKYLQEGL